MRERVVLVTDHTWPSVEPEAEVLARVGARLVVAERGDEEELRSLVPEADAILTCFKRVSPEVVRAGAQVQVIGRYGIGVDNIAVDEATRLGIPVTNVPVYCVDEVAEHALALLLSLARGIVRYDRAVREGDWALARGAPLHRIAGRTLGVLGLGRIGAALARRARALGLVVVAHDPSATPGELLAAGARHVSLPELVERSDFLSLHAPLTEDTRGLLDRELIARMRPGAILVNCARGALVDQEALEEALADGRLAGAGLDVFVPETLPPGHPLLSREDVVATPHVAFYSEESVLELEVRAAENVAAILDGRLPASVVNAEVLALPRWAHLRTP